MNMCVCFWISFTIKKKTGTIDGNVAWMTCASIPFNYNQLIIAMFCSFFFLVHPFRRNKS
jgi:hypothetical protein